MVSTPAVCDLDRCWRVLWGNVVVGGALNGDALVVFPPPSLDAVAGRGEAECVADFGR